MQSHVSLLLGCSVRNIYSRADSDVNFIQPYTYNPQINITLTVLGTFKVTFNPLRL